MVVHEVPYLLLNNKAIRIGVYVLSVIFVFKMAITLIPYPELSNFLKSHYSLSIQDREGGHLYTIPLDDGLKRYKVSSKELHKEVKKAVLQSEDRWFYYHYGFNVISIVRTAVQNHKEGRVVSGASTIPMQLARIIHPREKGMKSKLLEIIDAVRIEAKLSKNEILSLYLSHLPFGKNMEGYGTASQFYYNKPLDELTMLETQVLSIIPRSPVHYDPFKHPYRVKKAVMRVDNSFSEDQIEQLLNQISNREHDIRDPIKAPHFVNYVKSKLDDSDYQKGNTVVTTLDLSVQMWAEDLLNFYLDTATHSRVSNGALLLLMDNEVLAYVGSKDFYNEQDQGQIDGVQILRQPGSTLKPFLYELAFEMGFTPASIIPDIPTSFGSSETYRPENYSQTYHGPVRIRTALGSSLNIPAVYMLERVGVNNFVDRLKKLGFESLSGQENNLGLGLAVGNAEVSLYELVQAFSVFKNNGLLKKSTCFFNEETQEPVMDSVYASITRDILSDKESRILGFGRNSVLSTKYPSYFKTGTSNQFNNIWALGATKDLTCGVWMGNFSGETVIGRSGSSLPAKVVSKVLEEYSNKRDFPELEGCNSFEICPLSGGQYTDNCNTKKTEYFKAGTSPEPCKYHSSDGTIEFPPMYSQWAQMYSYNNYGFSDSNNTVLVSSPQDGAVYYLSSEIPESSQGVEFHITGEGAFSIGSDGVLLHKGTLPFQDFISLGKGVWDLDITTSNGTIERRVEVQ